jgi:hypothetical protein
MSVYDGRLKHVRDYDLFYAREASVGSTVSYISDTIDFGAAQAFLNKPVHVFWSFSLDFSMASSIGDICLPPAIIIQDSADGSTWAGSIAMIGMRAADIGVAAASSISATYINGKNIGVGSIKRYSRICFPRITATSPSPKFSAWARMGLSD